MLKKCLYISVVTCLALMLFGCSNASSENDVSVNKEKEAFLKVKKLEMRKN